MVYARSIFEEDHAVFRETVRRFLTEEVAPHLDQWRRGGGVGPRLWVSAAELGLLGTMAPEELGGGGVDDPRFVAMLVEETMTAGATGLAHLLALSCGVCLPALIEYASVEQLTAWLEPVIEGRGPAVPVAVGPPLEAHADDGEWRLSGWAPAVPGGASAALLVVGFSTEGEDGVAVIDGDRLGLQRRSVADALGGRDAGQADIHFDDVRVGPGDVLANGETVLRSIRRDLDLWTAVLAAAGALGVLTSTVEYVGSRRVFGRLLAEFENTRHRLAEAAVLLTAAQLIVDDSVRARWAGTLSAGQAAAARITAAQAHDEAVDRGLQLHGGYGYMREYPISVAFADAQYLRQQERQVSDARDVVAAGIGL
ncbi:acyl-CoA dehydrogenase family protein [Parafrankia sp. FMc2]|uniref:acyl-CoA dehydrogenase family protein n=1 Tax=Parafrankia sp. FMc2 TaxID=3233196 RepID=UPI0034D61829